jgi:predicted acyl esterase
VTESPPEEPTDEDVVEAASDAAEGLILDRYKQSDITDMDVTVRFEDGTLDVDVYLNAPDEPDPAVVAQDAVGAAEDAVDELFDAA